MRKPVTDAEKKIMRELRAGGMTYAKIGAEVGCSYTTAQYVCNPKYRAGRKAYKQTPEYKAKRKAYRHTPERMEYQRAYKQTPEYKAYQKACRQTPEYKAYQRAWFRAYRQTEAGKAKMKARSQTPEYKAYIADYNKRFDVRLRSNLRNRLKMAIKGNFKAGSAVSDLGCSIDYLITYFVDLFQPGMTWDNWGKYSWHIDHIRPLSSFDLTDREQFLKACHYTNLQPLWATDNLRKCAKY